MTLNEVEQFAINLAMSGIKIPEDMSITASISSEELKDMPFTNRKIELMDKPKATIYSSSTGYIFEIFKKD